MPLWPRGATSAQVRRHSAQGVGRLHPKTSTFWSEAPKKQKKTAGVLKNLSKKPSRIVPGFMNDHTKCFRDLLGQRGWWHGVVFHWKWVTSKTPYRCVAVHSSWSPGNILTPGTLMFCCSWDFSESSSWENRQVLMFRIHNRCVGCPWGKESQWCVTGAMELYIFSVRQRPSQSHESVEAFLLWLVQMLNKSACVTFCWHSLFVCD